MFRFKLGDIEGQSQKVPVFSRERPTIKLDINTRVLKSAQAVNHDINTRIKIWLQEKDRQFI
jgi:hypothetical protein